MMKKCYGIVAALAVMGLATAAHAAVAGVHALAVAGPPPAPEPGSLGILAAGAMMLLGRRRRRE